MAEKFLISAPGKVILHGEHSVVYGKVAVAAALNLRTYLLIQPTSNGQVKLTLPDIGLKACWSVMEIEKLLVESLCDPVDPKPGTDAVLENIKSFTGISFDTTDTKVLALVSFLYLYGSIAWHDGHLPSVEVTVCSKLPIGSGLGSSGAFSVCLAAGLLQMIGYIVKPYFPSGESGTKTYETWSEKENELINGWAFQAEKIIHGRPSGIDNSICTYGRALQFQKGTITHIVKMPKLQILLTNTKVARSTKALVGIVKAKYDQYPTITESVLQSMEAIAERAVSTYIEMADSKSWEKSYAVLEELTSMNQLLLELLGVSHPSLQKIIEKTDHYRLKTKLTGAGGGGCACTLLRPDTTDDVMTELKTVLAECGYACWQTTVGGIGVIQHFSATDGMFNIPERLQKIF